MQTKNNGFTLLELMFVVAIIGILAAVAIPAYSDYIAKSKVSETFILASNLTKTIGDYYAYRGTFPKDNQAVDLPEPKRLGGQYFESIQIENGAIHAMNFYGFEKGTVLTLRPAIVDAYPPSGAITWVCGYAKVPEGMTIIGENKTKIETKHLPRVCQ